jgi:hypothetical protein
VCLCACLLVCLCLRAGERACVRAQASAGGRAGRQAGVNPRIALHGAYSVCSLALLLSYSFARPLACLSVRPTLVYYDLYRHLQAYLYDICTDTCRLICTTSVQTLAYLYDICTDTCRLICTTSVQTLEGLSVRHLYRRLSVQTLAGLSVQTLAYLSISFPIYLITIYLSVYLQTSLLYPSSQADTGPKSTRRRVSRCCHPRVHGPFESGIHNVIRIFGRGA